MEVKITAIELEYLILLVEISEREEKSVIGDRLIEKLKEGLSQIEKKRLPS